MARRLKQNFNEVQAILDAVGQKVDKVEGKNLSTNDYTDEDKAKLSSVEEGAEPNVQGDWEQTDTTSDGYIKNKPDLSVKADLPLESIDISGLTVRNGYITSSGVWNSGSTYCHTLLPVSAGKAVRVTAAESNLFRYAWLTSGRAPRGGIAADLVPGTERTDVAAGSSVSLVVPDGAKYLYVYLGTPAAKANTPESMAVSDTIASLRKDTDTNAGDIAVLGEEARHSGVYGHFDGAGTSISDGGNIYVVAGMSYRLTMLHPDITVTDPTGNVWRLVVSARDDSGAVVSNLVQVSDVSRLSDHYDLTIPAGATRLYIYGRCTAGQTCDYVLERLDTQTYNDGDILTLNPDSEFLTKWQSAMKPYYTSRSTSNPNCVRFLHLSDVHGNWANVRRFLKFYNHWVDKGYDITAINTGDTATDYLTDGVTGYTSINGVDKILGVVGNHDTRGTSGWQQYKGLEVYNALFAPLISGWGVVQPEGAAENGYCYYHKDYASNKLRLVVVDIMGYDDTEDAWLASVLASAKTAGYHVLIATHFAGGRSSAEASRPPYKKIDCQWSTMAGLASDSTQLNGYNSESYKMADTVHAFMEDGGIFCGYMCGHSHLEFIARLDKYPDQMIYTIGSSKSGKVHDYTHTTGTRMQDEFEIVAVDTDSKFVKLYKVGANYDRRGRHKDSVCVSYDTHEVVGFPVTVEALSKEMDGKQEKLVSGQNIKTVNGQSVLGGGNIALNGGNIDYTGAEGDAAVIHGESIDYNIKALDDMAAYLTNNKQGTINDLDTIRAGAAAGATAYQKPSGGIPASDIASGVIPTNVVKYTEQELTEAQQEQARDNIGAAATSGYYPDLHVGEADYLPGTEVEQVEGISTVAKSTGLARIKEVKGKSLVWNQLVKNGDFSDGLTDWNHSAVIATVNADDVTIHATSESYTAQNFNQALPTFSGRKYLLSFIYKSDTAATTYFANANGVNLPASESFVEKKLIITSSGYNVLRFYPSTGAQYSPSAIFTLKKRIVAHDLTQLFGSGNEPSTVAEFESWLANNIGYRDYYAYNPGEIISNNTEALEITGLNQWDEEWEHGSINLNTGANSASANAIRSKNYCPISSVYNYFGYRAGLTNRYSMYVAYYDSEKNYISSESICNRTGATPQNARYFRLWTSQEVYSTDYKHDICINVSGSSNGQYEPYHKSEFALDLPTLTGKLNGEGESVTIFPDGMRSVMDANDSLVVDEDGWCRTAKKTVFSLDLGDVNWAYNKNNQGAFSNLSRASLFASGRNLCAKYTSPNTSRPASMPDKSIAINSAPLTTSGNFSSKEIVIKDSSYTDAADFKAAVTGVKLYYEGYTQEYVLDTPIYMGIKTQQGGVIRQLPENGSEPTTAPMRMDITYALPPEALISGSSLENLLKALKSANKISNYTMTYNATSGKWEFTIS